MCRKKIWRYAIATIVFSFVMLIVCAIIDPETRFQFNPGYWEVVTTRVENIYGIEICIAGDYYLVSISPED